MIKAFLRSNDYVFGLCGIGLAAILFLFPVALGFQSLLEAYPVLYQSHNLVPPQIKTPWVIDGATMVRSTIPTTLFAVQLMKSGHLPFWSPYDGAGEPLMLLGSGLYNPLRLLYFLLWSAPRAFDWSIILRTILAGFGMFLYLHALGLKRRAALFGGIAYMFSGYFFTFFTYWFLDIEAITPFILFAMERYLRGGTRGIRYLFLVGILSGFLAVTGQPQSVILNGMLFGGYFLWRIFFDPELRARWLVHLMRISLCVVIAGLIALPYAIDFFTFFSQGLTIYDYGPFVAAKHGLEHASPIYLLHLLVSPSTVLEVAIGGHLFSHFSDIVPYLALTALLLIFLSFFIKKKPKWVLYYCFFCAFALLKIFGIPPIQWIGHLPILNNIGWHKLYGPLALAVAAIAAYVYDALPAISFNKKKFLMGCAAIPLLFILVFLFAPSQFLTSYIPDLDFLNRRAETIASAMRVIGAFPLVLQKAALAFISDGRYFTLFLFARAFLFSLAALGLILWAAGKPWKHKAHFFLLSFLIFELFVYMPKVRDGFRYFDPYVKPPFVEYLSSHAPGSEVGVISTDYTFPVSLGDLWGIRKFQTTSAIFPKRFWQFVPDTIRANDHDYFKLKAEDVAKTPQKFFDAANLRYLVTEATSSFANVNFSLTYDKDLKIYENKTALPRAYLAFQKIEANAPEDARIKFYSQSFDPTQSVILEDKGNVFLPDAGSLRYAPARITEYAADRIVIHASSSRDAVLVVTDAYYSSWRAFLDGKEVPVYPANILFRGVFVPRGEHEIRFEYIPPLFWPSVFISYGTVLISLMLIFGYDKVAQMFSLKQNGG